MKKLIAIILLSVMAVTFGAEIVENGATSVILYVVICDADGDPNESVTVTDLDFFWVETGAALESDTSITACSSSSAAYATGTAIHLEEGLYRVDFDDDCFDGGVGKQVQLIVDDVGTSNRTSFLSILLTPAVDANKVAGATPATPATINAATFADPNWTDLATNIDDIETDTAAMDDAAGMKTLVWGSTATDLTGEPGDDATLFEMLNWLYKLSRNKMTQTATESQFYDVDGAIISEATVSDNGTTFTREEYRADD